MECDSELVALALTDHSLVSWWLRNCWRNCLFLCKDITLFCSHIYKEGNSCADRLANHGASASTPFFFGTLLLILLGLSTLGIRHLFLTACSPSFLVEICFVSFL